MFQFALFAFVLLVGLSSAGPVAVPQSGAAGSGGRDDPANYFGGIYIGSDEVEEDQVDDDQYGEYNPDDYFGGVYIGPDKEGRSVHKISPCFYCPHFCHKKYLGKNSVLFFSYFQKLYLKEDC